jgi:serpin B
MAETLGTWSSGETSGNALGEIIRRLNASSDQYELVMANSLWGQEGKPLQADFLEAITRYYGGIVKLVDFRRKANGVGAIINKWVEDNTKQKILNLIPAGGLSAETRLILVNAVYFKGRWVLQFPKGWTCEEPFHLDGGGIVRAPLMHQQEKVRYLQGAGFQAVDLLYEGMNLSMLVLLPDRRDGLADLERELSSSMLRDCVAKMCPREVKLFLPRFKITWGTVNLCDPLAGLGMSLPFDRSRADFSGINGCRPPAQEALAISAVYHKAFADVNEEGTEAAAATAVALYATMARPQKPPQIPVFRADHAFLFAILERHTGTILFLGCMANPTEGS